MPTYDYFCAANNRCVEVIHSIHDKVNNWGELCEAAGCSLGDTTPDTLVTRVITAPSLAFPKTNTELKNMGFTKLVKREKGVYENVTANEGDARFMKSDDPSSIPKLTNKISD